LLSCCPPVLLSFCPPVLLSSCPPVLLSSVYLKFGSLVLWFGVSGSMLRKQEQVFYKFNEGFWLYFDASKAHIYKYYLQIPILFLQLEGYKLPRLKQGYFEEILILKRAHALGNTMKQIHPSILVEEEGIRYHITS
jgi:hypothetical protein